MANLFGIPASVPEPVRRLGAVPRIVGLLLTLFSLTLLPPVLVSLYYQDGTHIAFLTAFALTLITGAMMWRLGAGLNRDLRIREGFVVVVSFWVVLGLFGAIPLYLAERPVMTFTEAAFESISGLTTTGATVITGLDTLPKGILYYRQQLQWFGGMGIVVLAVAILPLLGVGGMQLYQAEIPGPVKNEKLTPRIAETAKALWAIYLGLTVACAALYWLAGMQPFEAIGHSFSTVAIGGFSTHDLSTGYYNSAAIESIAVFFMFAAGINFALHYRVWQSADIRSYLADTEFRTFLALVVGVTTVATGVLYFHGTYPDADRALIKALFQVVSIGTTTGFTTADYATWPSFLPMMLLLGSFVGGCAASTAGGMKVIRFVLLWKQGLSELKRLVHPSAMIPVKLGGRNVPSDVLQAVWGFFAVYIAIFIVLFIIMLATGLDELTAFSAVAACLNNLGPGLGEVSGNMTVVNAPGKWVLILAMLLGRLEIFTLIAILSPAFWRR
jgi:trk system potassium uptake protein TrkH